MSSVREFITTIRLTPLFFCHHVITPTVVRFQHKHYLPLTLFLGLVAPTLLGHLWGDAIGGYVWGGLVARLFSESCWLSGRVRWLREPLPHHLNSARSFPSASSLAHDVLHQQSRPLDRHAAIHRRGVSSLTLVAPTHPFRTLDCLSLASRQISARGNYILALLTSGEANHNFHHRFA